MVPHMTHASTHASTPAPSRRATTAAAPFDCVSACPLYESTINQYFTDVAAASATGVSGIAATDNVYSVATQYTDANNAPIQYNETFGGSYADGNPFPTTGACHDGVNKYCVTNKQLTAQIQKVITANHLPRFSTTTLYFIFTPARVGVCFSSGSPGKNNPCTTNAFCAYHDASVNGFVYAVEPDAQAIPGDVKNPHPCDPGQAPAGNSADATLNTISHEQIESITDPFNTGWISGDTADNNPEIGDLCAYDFGTPLGGTPGTEYNQTINGHSYYLQLEYSNAAANGAGGCVPYLGGPVTAADPQNGVGPLVFGGGEVMTTNTVYAIYWVPAAPVSVKPPTITGIPKAGKLLKSMPGSWQNSPTYTYRWLRCSSAGTSCKGISLATHSSYSVAKADVGHKLELRVTGTNMMGAVNATSAPTAIVAK